MFQYYTDDINTFLVLFMLSKCTDNQINGATRIQKTVFICEWIGRKKKLDNFNYTFYRWNYGPYSKELSDDLRKFVSEGYIEIYRNNPKVFKLSNSGSKYLNYLINDLNINTDALKLIEYTCSVFEKMDIDKIIEIVYKEIDLLSNFRMGEVIIRRKKEKEFNQSLYNRLYDLLD